MQAPPVATMLGAAALAITITWPRPARADPDDIIARPLVLEPGSFDLRLTAEINVQPRTVGTPLSLAPDAWWGVAPRWTIGIIHSDPSVDQIDASASLCLRQSELSACDRLYHGSGVDVRFGALAGQFALAPRLRLLIRELDPFKPAVTMGALARWTHGRFAITTDPYLRLPLANHELGNRAAVFLPLWFAVQPASGWAIALHSGFDADLVVLRDGGHVPIALDVTARITGAVDLGLEAGWGTLLGPQHDAKHGTVIIAAGWHD